MVYLSILIHSLPLFAILVSIFLLRYLLYCCPLYWCKYVSGGGHCCLVWGMLSKYWESLALWDHIRTVIISIVSVIVRSTQSCSMFPLIMSLTNRVSYELKYSIKSQIASAFLCDLCLLIIFYTFTPMMLCNVLKH